MKTPGHVLRSNPATLGGDIVKEETKSAPVSVKCVVASSGHLFDQQLQLLWNHFKLPRFFFGVAGVVWSLFGLFGLLLLRYYTKYRQEHGRTNGTVVACRMMHERRRNDVASILVFADPAAEAKLTRQGMGLLDSAYPKAVKLGLVTAAASTSSAGNSGNSMSSMYMGGRFGGLRAGGVMGILLSNPADSAVGLCGCEVVGPFWEVFEYDSSPRSSVIKTVSDPKSSKLDGDGRRLAMTMAEAISELEEELGRALSTKDLWVGIRRGHARATRVEASASGEWALHLSCRCQDMPGHARTCQDMPGYARTCQDHPGPR